MSSSAGIVVGALFDNPEARRATAYMSPRITVKATRQRPRPKHAKSETFIVTIGRPNYRERAVIKRGPLPSGVLLDAWPKKRRAKRK